MVVAKAASKELLLGVYLVVMKVYWMAEQMEQHSVAEKDCTTELGTDMMMAGWMAVRSVY